MHIGFHIAIPSNMPIDGGEIPSPGKIIYGLESVPAGLYALESGSGFYGCEEVPIED